MEFNIVSLDMIFTLGIKEFSGVALSEGMIEQFNLKDNILYYWDSGNEEWHIYNNVNTCRGHLEKHYHTFFTWEIVNNEI